MSEKLYSVTVDNMVYKVKDPIMFNAMIMDGIEPGKALELLDQVLDAIDKIFDGMCIALTYLPNHKVEYIHNCVDGTKMKMLIEKFIS